MNILLIQLRQLGDILLTTPCIREIKLSFPTAQVSFLSHAMGRLILDDNPYLDRRFYYDDDAGLLRSIKLAYRLRQQAFDVVIDFMNNPRSAFFASTTASPKRIGFSSARELIYTDTVPRPDGSEYIVRQKFRLLNKLGIYPENIQLDLNYKEYLAAAITRLKHAIPNIAQAPIKIVLSPTHRRRQRRWPLINFARLADRLVEQWGAHISWLWGPDEEQLIDEVMRFCQQRTFKMPPTSFKEMAALLSYHDLFIGNSNGPSHVAVAVDTYSLQLHGPTLATSWCPMNRFHQALQADDGLSTLSLETVWQKLLEMRTTMQL